MGTQTRSIPPVSIVIPALNEEGYLPSLLQSLAQIESPLDILVVDGESTDKTVEVAEAHIPLFVGQSSLRVIRSPRGTALQRNEGAALAKHEILIFCDADMLMPSHQMHVRILGDFIRRDYAVAGPRLRPIEPGLRLALEHGFANFMVWLLHVFNKAYVPGGYLLTTKTIFARVGGFDTRIRLAEDIDYSTRAGRLGPAKLLSGHVRVSARRIIKYGYGWIYREIPNIATLLTKGTLADPDKIFYPFGEFKSHGRE